jgi:hypothetical protein
MKEIWKEFNIWGKLFYGWGCNIEHENEMNLYGKTSMH